MKIRYILVCLFGLMLTACEVPEEDFTSGNFYSIDPNASKEEEVDTAVIVVNPRECWDDGIMARHNEEYNEYFTRYGDGWIGGDATYSIPVDETMTFWIFGDTFLGTVRENRSRPGIKLLNNTIVKQEGDKCTTYYGGTTSNPEAFLKPPEEDWWYWPGHGQVVDGQVQLIMFALRRKSEGGAFGFEYAAVDLAILSLLDLEIVSFECKMEFKGANFGANLLQDGGYTYIYGAFKEGFNKFMHVARVQGIDLTQDWEYFAGSGVWSPNV